ncbi:MAG: tetratricopeptide repeat protein, partial [Aestuariivirga sp.]
TRISILALSTLLLATPAFPTASKKSIADCAAKDPATIVKGCTALFNETKGIPRGQAVALYNRGLAYNRLGQVDQAFADFNNAVALLKGHEEGDQKLSYNVFLERGRSYFSQKKYDEAAKDFEFASNLNRTDPKAVVNWAFALNELEDFEGADKQLFWAHALLPEDSTVLSLYGIVSFYLGRYDRASSYIEEALKFSPGMPYALNNRALMSFWKNDFSSALTDLDTVIAANPKDAWAHSLRARIHATQNDLVAARQDVDAALAASPQLARAHFTNGMVLAAENKADDAQAEFDKSYALDNTLTEALIESGKLAQSRKDFKSALAWYDKTIAAPTKTDQDKVRHDKTAAARTALQEQIDRPAKLSKLCLDKDGSNSLTACEEALANTTDKAERIPLLLAKLYVKPELAVANEILTLQPDNVLGLIQRGKIYQFASLQDLDKSLADFNAALAIDPKNSDALLGRSRTYGLRHETEKALADLDARIALEPTNSSLYFDKAFFLRDANDYKALLAVMEKLTNLAPDNHHTWRMMADAKLQLGDVSGAEETLQKAIAIRPDDKQVLGVQAGIALAKGDAISAIVFATKAIDLSFPPRMNMGAQLIRAKAYLQSGHPAGALQDSEQVLMLSPLNGEAHAVHASALLGVGDAAKALAESSQILQHDDKNVNIILVQATAHLQLNHIQEALDAASAGLAIAPEDARLLLVHGKANLALGQKEAALADFDKVSKLSPKDGTVALLRAQSHFDAGQFDDTLAALDGQTDSSPILTLKAEALLAKGDKAKALEALEGAVKLDAKNIRALRLTGDLYAALGTNDLAMQFYSKAIDAPAMATDTSNVEAAKAARAKLIDTLAKKTAD